MSIFQRMSLLWIFICSVTIQEAFAAQSYSGSSIEELMIQKIQDKVGKKKGSRYFMTLFSYEDDSQNPKASHTFASYVEVDASGVQLPPKTISWLPAEESERENLCVFKGKFWFIPGRNECPAIAGKNLTLKETVDIAVKDNRKLGMWGPFEVTPKLYELSQKRIASLDKNELEYIADDRAMRQSGQAVNCLHAVSDLGDTRSEQGGFLKTELGIWGFKGTKHILNHYIKHSSQWLKDSIGPEDVKVFRNDTLKTKAVKSKLRAPLVNKH